MYLLKPKESEYNPYRYTVFTFHYVSIKTTFAHVNSKIVLQFTFHYVSIKTKTAITTGATDVNLHSTMYLLKLLRSVNQTLMKYIYIPLCIY